MQVVSSKTITPPEPNAEPAAAEGVHQRRFFAADVRPGAAVQDNVRAEAAPQDILAQETPIARLLDGLRQPLHAEHKLTAAVNKGGPAAQRVGGDDHAFEQL